MERMFMPKPDKTSAAYAPTLARGRAQSAEARLEVPKAPLRRARDAGASLPIRLQTWLEPSEAFDQPGVDQEPVEATRFRSARTGVEEPFAALEDLLLFGEGRIERQSGSFLDHQRQIGSLDRLERRGEIDRFEVDRVDRVVGREIARVIDHEM